MNVERCLNLPIYLNPGWESGEYGGSSEIWSDDMKEKFAGFAPA
jgi:hypothetical protein